MPAGAPVVIPTGPLVSNATLRVTRLEALTIEIDPKPRICPGMIALEVGRARRCANMGEIPVATSERIPHASFAGQPSSHKM